MVVFFFLITDYRLLFNIYLFIYLFVCLLLRVLGVTHGIFCCGMQALHCGARAFLELWCTGFVAPWHVGS